MSNYLSFIYAGIKNSQSARPRGALDDGLRLAVDCIQQLERLDLKHFPPKLLILLASPGYIASGQASQLLEGIYREFTLQGFPDIPLIGTSVAAVFFKGGVHPNGALLVCLASRLLTVKTASSSSLGNSPDNTAKELLQKLEIDREVGEDPNLFANRALLTFFPGNSDHGYLAAKLHMSLRERVWARIPIVGGVSSGYDGELFRPGVQFFDKQVLKNAIVAARLTTRTLLGMSVGGGLERTKSIVHVTALGQDNHTVKEFNRRPSLDVLKELEQEYGFVVLGKRSYSGEPIVEKPSAVESPPAVKLLLHETREDDAFRVLKINPERLTKGASDSIENSCKAVGLSNPIGCLGFRCSGFFANQSGIDLDLQAEITEVERALDIHDGYVGGFVDGEAGRDNLGSSQLRSWSTSAVVFGDELRHRAAVYEGFYQTAQFLSRYPSQTESAERSIFALLKLIYDIGFPGARLFLVLDDNVGQRLVVPDARYTLGSLTTPDAGTFPHYIRLGSDEPSDDPAALVERTGEARFFAAGEYESQETSYYFSPLKTILYKVMAVLQIDVGKKKKLREDELLLLKRLGVIVGASLTRIFNWQESTIRNKLQDALKDSLSSPDTVEGVRKYLIGAVKALELNMGHIRRANSEDYKLELYAGIGDYYEAAREIRPKIDFGDISPTTKAYTTNDPTIVNDARNDPDHETMIRRWSDTSTEPQRRLKRALEGVGSYTNIPFRSERDFSGTINLISDQPWFFKYPQKRVLINIAEQVGFLIDHLEQKSAKEKERKKAKEASERERQTNKRQRFLLDVGAHLAAQDLEDLEGTLKDVLYRFCSTLHAEVGALYLWDEVRRLYVLRVQHGWDNPKLVNAATYTKNAGWFGARALQGEARYIPDLFEYYETEGYHRPTRDGSKPGGQYAEYMFGRKLSKDFTVEVLGLPLRSIREEDIGVLTLYRPIEKGQPSGFLKTVVDTVRDPKLRGLVTGAAYDVASLIGALLQHHNDKIEKDEQSRRKQISDALSRHVESESQASFAELICRCVCEIYGVAGADLYNIKWQGQVASLDTELRGTYPPRPEAVHAAPHPASDTYLNAAISVYAKKLSNTEIAERNAEITETDIKVKRKSISPLERNNPQLAATEGLVERICLPLILGQQRLWVLDLRRDVTSPQPHGAEGHLSSKYLWLLSDDLSKFSRLHIQTRERIQAEEKANRHQKSQQELLGKVGVVAQLAHGWRDRITNLREEASGIKRTESMIEQGHALDQLLTNLNDFGEEVFNLLKLTEKNLQPRALILRDFIQTEDETRIISKRYKDKEISCRVDIPDELQVYVRSLSMGFAFQNIVDNAIKATAKVSDASLSISAVAEKESGRVHVYFANNGDQIEPEIRDAINNSRYEELGAKWGLVIAKCFAQYNDGDLTIETPEEGGTVMVFNLPLAPCIEEEARWT
jgi:signal transduction histidine kinase